MPPMNSKKDLSGVCFSFPPQVFCLSSFRDFHLGTVPPYYLTRLPNVVPLLHFPQCLENLAMLLMLHPRLVSKHNRVHISVINNKFQHFSQYHFYLGQYMLKIQGFSIKRHNSKLAVDSPFTSCHISFDLGIRNSQFNSLFAHVPATF